MASNLSSRHHYLPTYYSAGFTNSNGFLFIYDKQKDTLNDRPVPPKSIFYEWDRNTVDDKNGVPFSLIEDAFYSKVDSQISKIIIDLREKPISKGLLTPHYQGNLHYFMIDLYWRNPKIDGAFKRLLNEAKITFKSSLNTNEINEQILKNDPSFLKMQRIGMASTTIDRSGELPKTEVYYSIIELDKKIPIVISDFPIVFEKTPSTFPDLHFLDYYLPISSSRIWSQRKLRRTSPATNQMAAYFNILAFDQAKRYVGCSDYDALKSTIKSHQVIKDRNLIPECITKLFLSE